MVSLLYTCSGHEILDTYSWFWFFFSHTTPHPSTNWSELFHYVIYKTLPILCYFASTLAQTISSPRLSIEQLFNIPTLQPVISWAARLTLLKGMPDHISPLLQTFHGLPILPTMKTRHLQWFVSSVHVLVLDYLFELTSYYIAVACLASVIPANLLFLNTIGTFQSHCLCCFHCWEYSSDIFIPLSLTSCKCLLIYHLHNCI